MFKLFALGNVVRDAEQSFTTGGKAVVKVTVAVNTGYGDKKETVYLNLAIWQEGRQKVAMEHFKTGTKLVVECEPHVRAYVSNGGEPKISFDATLVDFSFAGGSGSGTGTGGEEPTQAPAEPAAPAAAPAPVGAGSTSGKKKTPF